MTRVRTLMSGTVAEFVLDHPPLNLVDLEVIGELEGALAKVAEWVQEGSCRAFVLRAEGRFFCAGVDVRAFLGHDEAGSTALMVRLLALTQQIEALPIPTIAVVHGLNLTIGFELSLGCDGGT
jgi:enoyl-CoA hydratase